MTARASFPKTAVAEALKKLGADPFAELVTAVGSLPIRAGKAFESARKLGKTHQNVLVFCNGDQKKATAAIGPVEFSELDEAND